MLDDVLTVVLVCRRCLAGITERTLVIQSYVFCDLLVPAAKFFRNILKLHHTGLSELLTASLNTLHTATNLNLVSGEGTVHMLVEFVPKWDLFYCTASCLRSHHWILY